jgi:deoxyribodipyrimidine photolyase
MEACSPAPRLGRVLVWFRRDLRLEDNPALLAALQLADEVVSVDETSARSASAPPPPSPARPRPPAERAAARPPRAPPPASRPPAAHTPLRLSTLSQIPVFVYAPEEEGQFQPGRCSRWWLAGSLRALDAALRAAGSRLRCLRAPDSAAALATAAAELGARAVFFNHLYDAVSMVRDAEVKAALAAAGVLGRSFGGELLREPWEVVRPDTGAPFSTYADFWAAHCALPPPPRPAPAPAALPPPPPGGLALAELGIMAPEEEASNAQLGHRWSPGAPGAAAAMAAFLGARLRAFAADRARCDRASTSRLSPHLHYGELSPRALYWAVRDRAAAWAAEDAAASAGNAGAAGPSGAAGPDATGNGTATSPTAAPDFLRQLGFREYSRYLSFHFPFTHERALLEHLRAVPWRLDQGLFKAWRTGATGFPLVDAAMREVWATGYAHNRARVAAARFLVQRLLLPWQWGLKHYWDALLDADLECDTLGWQYCAGCLADAPAFGAPADLAAEAAAFDPDGSYVRRWIPALARLPTRWVHAPWEAPAAVLDDAGVELGSTYPWPVVALEEANAALAAAVAVMEEAASAAAARAAAGGPFRPATAPAGPGAASRVWGGSRGGSAPGSGAARRAAALLGEGEEVLSCCSEGGSVAGAAAARPAASGSAAAPAAPLPPVHEASGAKAMEEDGVAGAGAPASHGGASGGASGRASGRASGTVVADRGGRPAPAPAAPRARSSAPGSAGSEEDAAGQAWPPPEQKRARG